MNSVQRTFGFINNHPLARKHLFRAYWHFMSWQIRSRLTKEFLKVPFIENTRLIAKKGLAGVTGNIYTGLFDFEDMSFLLHVLREGDVFVDVGANAGSYTILAAGVTKARCVSFEPVPSSFAILNENIVLNDVENLVEAKNIALSNASGSIDFTTDEDAGNHVVSPGEKEKNCTRVKMEKLDNLTFSGPPVLMKIDVEGYESPVLDGAEKTLMNPDLRAIIIELNGSGKRYGFDEKKIHEKLSAYGFSRFEYDPFSRQLELRSSRDQHNTLYLRDIYFIKERVKNAKPFRIFGELI